MGLFSIFSHHHEPVELFYDTDVHCHILPGVDHGAADMATAMDLLRREFDMGIRHVICTSHVTEGTFENTRESLTAAYDALCAEVKRQQLPIELHVSAEYRLDDYFLNQYHADALLPMPGNWLLVENSFQQELLNLDELLFELQIKGYNIVMAHPERYAYYGIRRERYEQLHNAGVKFQINLLSLAGYFGGNARDNALWLIKNNMVEMLGSDMHFAGHAEEISKYLASREWRKLSERLEPHIINDRLTTYWSSPN